MVRPYQESLAVKVRPELAQGPYQTEHFSPSRAIPTLSLGQRATRVRHDSFSFLFSLAQHRPKAVSAGVHVDNELPMEVRIGEDRRRCKRGGDVRKTVDELAVVRRQPQELPQLRNASRCSPLPHGRGFAWVRSDPFFRDDVAQVRHPPLHEPAFFWFDFQTHFPEATEHLAQSCRMLFSSLAKYDDVVQVYQAVGAHQASQDCLHEPLKGGRCVAQFKKHHFELVQPKGGGEGRLLPILLFDLNLPGSACQVQGRKPLCTCQRVQSVVNPRERVGILPGEVVQLPVIDTEPA
ncbi:hypothetical protein T01_6013 [Trichinella spiralis]|uniref:Uncharacterized protein n=1 Tax=Trichinella spiralis TaxID=6334 RepID=A0A0V1APS4_TRISP|nr:hypothetical protein T01_6013 [Trichinella spiralis]